MNGTPAFKERSFHCPFCGVLCAQLWNNLKSQDYKQVVTATTVYISQCTNCKHEMLWWDEHVVSPPMSVVPVGHNDMPRQSREVYDEARLVFTSSARSSAALLRLCIEMLCANLGKGDLRLNDAIAALVREGLSVKVQRALDIVRVVGNNAIHPGQITVNDDQDTALALFALVNYVVERMISEPARIDRLFENLPDNAKLQIDRRDGFPALPAPE